MKNKTQLKLNCIKNEKFNSIEIKLNEFMKHTIIQQTLFYKKGINSDWIEFHVPIFNTELSL